jgi:2-isopropylmalate synthase
MIKHLTEEEVKMIREGVRLRRTPETLIEDKWSVSPLNRDRDVVGHYPRKVTLRDITLRTIEQTPGVWISEIQRRRLMERLVEVGIKSFQCAWLVFSDVDDLRKEIGFMKNLSSDVEVTVLATGREFAAMAAAAGADVYVTYAPAIWEFNLIYGTYGRKILRAHRANQDWRSSVAYPKSEDEQLDSLADDVTYARSLGLKSAIHVSMLHYATADYVRRLAQRAVEVNADEIDLADGASAVSPEAWGYLVRQVREVAPELRIGLHTHNGFGLAQASALSGIREGATSIDVAVNHLCSGAGQVDLAEAAASLEVLYGVETGIDLKKLTRLARFVEDISGVRMAQNKPITGSHAWDYTEEAMAEEESFAPVHKSVNPEIFGNKSRYVLGRYSGISGVEEIVTRLAGAGISIPHEQVRRIFAILSDQMATVGRTFSDDEIMDEVRQLIDGGL